MKKLLCLGVLAVLMRPAPAAADTLGTLYFNGFSTLTNGESITLNGQGVWAGEIDWTLKTLANPTGELFRGYCVDLYDEAETGAGGEFGTLTTTASLTGANSVGVLAGAGAKAAWLVNNYGGGTSAADAAGLQIAIWQALYGSNAFTFAASGAATAAAASYLALVNAANVAGSTAQYFNVSNILPFVGQDQIRIGTPEPATILLMLLALGGLLIYQSRSKRSEMAA